MDNFLDDLFSNQIPITPPEYFPSQMVLLDDLGVNEEEEREVGEEREGGDEELMNINNNNNNN